MTTSVKLPCAGAEEGARGDFTYFVCVCVRAGDLLISVLPQLAAHHVGP